MAAVRCEVDGAALRFRLPTRAEVEDYLEAARKRPGEQLELGSALCAACCIDGPIAEVTESRPLALVESVLPLLFSTASSRATAARRAGIARWKRAETDLGRMADSLLAFKSYIGGEPSEAAFAGALHVAEWLDSTRGTFRLFSAFLKALSRRR